MLRSSRASRSSWLLAFLIVPAVGSRAQSPEAAPKKQLPADQRAFKAARATVDPEARLAAMKAFVKDYPKSESDGRAEAAILTVLLDNFPERTDEIEANAKLQVKKAGKGASLERQEVYIAFQLAEAGRTGVALTLAEKLAKDALSKLTQPIYEKETIAMYAKYKMPAPKAAEVREQYANTRADALAVLADVYLREGKVQQASPLIAEAFGLDPLVDDVNTQRGRLALLQHDDALALDSFERAQLLGSLKPVDRETMMELYRKSHGSDEGFTAAMDARYVQLYPAPFTPTRPKAVASGHTVLVELFTGSACGPCVGGDLAVEGLLAAYPRSEVVALAFDQHVPEPDPLTNPDSVARGKFYDLAFTPTYVLDGKNQPLNGADRAGSKAIYDGLTKAVDAAAVLATGVQLTLTADRAPGGLVQAHAAVTLPNVADLRATLTPKTVAVVAGDKAAKVTAPVTAAAIAPLEPHLVVNFALVEDEIRYSGENGIRFHRMVVRSLAKPADSGFSVDPAGSANLDASFDPAAISKALTAYLDGYEEQNDRFGKVKFLTKDMRMQPGHLMIAAWVQDAVTHQVLQTALIPVTGETTKEGE